MGNLQLSMVSLRDMDWSYGARTGANARRGRHDTVEYTIQDSGPKLWSAKR